jgi:hypothetical protein
VSSEAEIASSYSDRVARSFHIWISRGCFVLISSNASINLLCTRWVFCSPVHVRCVQALSDMNSKLEEERQMLMKQLQAVMNQVQELLTELISSKDNHASDQKTYL